MVEPERHLRPPAGAAEPSPRSSGPDPGANEQVGRGTRAAPRRYAVQLGVATLAALMAVGTAAACGGGDSGDGGKPSDSAPVGWTVGSCIRQVSGPTAIPTELKPAQRDVMKAQQQFEPVACTDDRALSKIEAMGATPDPLGQTAESGCPDDTDQVFKQTGPLAIGRQLVCARNLKEPHPGDPGGGGGPAIVVGDCVYIGSNANSFNDIVGDVPCAEQGWFAKVLAKASAKTECPADTTLSRIAVSKGVLCLGDPDGTGLIAKIGDCVDITTNMLQPPYQKPCGSLTGKVTAVVDDAKKCPSGTHGRPTTGYDRPLCIKVQG